MFFKVFKKTWEQITNGLMLKRVNARKGNRAVHLFLLFSFILETNMQKHNIFLKMSYFCGEINIESGSQQPVQDFICTRFIICWQPRFGDADI
jgi:hypothetical protein